MAQWTIRSRLIGSLLGQVAVLWIVGVVIAGLVVHHEVNEVFDSALRETTAQIIPIALHEYQLKTSAQGIAAPEQELASLNTRRGHVHFLLRDRGGVLLVASQGAPSEQLPKPKANGFRNVGAFRYYARYLTKENVWIEVAQELHERQEAAFGIWLALASPLFALLPIAALAVWKVVGRATEPILSVSSELEARGGDHLEPIDGAGLPGELAPVIVSINTLMARLKEALEAERAFAANAAHELRNPIASARAQIQVLSGKLMGTAEQVRTENIASQLGQLGRRIERLLQMSRADAGLGRARDRSDLVGIVTLVMDDYGRRPDVGPRLNLEVPNEESCWVAMDQDALAIVLRNAIENAVSHGSPGEPIDVRVGSDHTVSVINGCSVVPDDMLRALKDRFRRGEARGSGSGLGLAIVDTIMRQAGGAVMLHSPARGRADGFEVMLSFPGAV